MTKLEEFNIEYKPASNSPFTIAFCYPKFSEPFVVKGGWIDVEKFISSKKEPLLVHITYWKMKTHRTIINTYNLSQDIFFAPLDSLLTSTRFPVGGLRNKRWKIFTLNKDHIKKELAVLRKVPRKWLKELDPYCPATRGEHRRLFRLKNLE
jgi:hypothetical protein